MAGKVQTSIEKKGQLTLAMKKFIVDQRETKKTDINEIIRRVYNEFQVTTSPSLNETVKDTVAPREVKSTFPLKY